MPGAQALYAGPECVLPHYRTYKSLKGINRLLIIGSAFIGKLRDLIMLRFPTSNNGFGDTIHYRVPQRDGRALGYAGENSG